MLQTDADNMTGARTKPDFLIIGAQKAGTTSLYRYLISNPRVLPAKDKQLHYFDFNFDKPVEWYEAKFPDKEGRHGVVTGEATPYYLFHPDAAARAAHLFPDCKLIALLRDPVDRACSHYFHELKNGTEPLSFEEALAAEEERLRGEEEKIMRAVNLYSFNHVKYSYLARGRYAEQVEKWLARFPRERFLFVQSERLFTNPEAVMDRVFEFLGVPPYGPIDFKVHNKNPIAKKEIAEDTKARLRAYFEPYNRKLFDMIGEEFDW